MLCLAAPATGTMLSSVITGMALGMTQMLVALRDIGVGRAVRLVGGMGGITHLIGTAALQCLLLRREGAAAAFARLEQVIVRGDAMLTADLTLLRGLTPQGCGIWFSYGLTETSNIAGWCIPPEFVPETARVPAGYLRAGLRYAVLDEGGQPVPDTAPGELWISSRDLMQGEWQRGRVVNGRLTPDPGDPGRYVFRTGDLVRIARDGLLWVLGRGDRLIKINGMRIDPAEPENLLRAAPGVADAVVLVEHHGNSPRLIAHVVPRDTPVVADIAAGDVQAQAAFVAELRVRLHAALPVSMHPARFVLAQEVPRLGSGKPDLAALSDAADSGRM